jgi:hypothetical protein
MNENLIRYEEKIDELIETVNELKEEEEESTKKIIV